LPIDCVDFDLRANPSRVIHEQPRNIARTRGKIDNAHVRAGHYPTPHEDRNQTVATEPAIKLPKPFKIALQFGRNRLWPIHHFQNGRVEAALHSRKIESGKQEPRKEISEIEGKAARVAAKKRG
jgi:hypothetical protein